MKTATVFIIEDKKEQVFEILFKEGKDGQVKRHMEFDYFDFGSKEKSRRTAKAVAMDLAFMLQNDFNVKFSYTRPTI